MCTDFPLDRIFFRYAVNCTLGKRSHAVPWIRSVCPARVAGASRRSKICESLAVEVRNARVARKALILGFEEG